MIKKLKQFNSDLEYSKTYNAINKISTFLVITSWSTVFILALIHTIKALLV